MKHTLSPFVEKSLVALAACAGAVFIYFASIEPFVAATTAGINSVPERVTSDIDAWTRASSAALGVQYGIPPGWAEKAAADGRVLITPAPGLVEAAGRGATVFSMELRQLGAREHIENVAAAEFAGTRPALYDVAVDGREALFAASFNADGRIAQQAVYVLRGDKTLIIRGDRIDPPTFSSFISTVKFFKLTL